MAKIKSFPNNQDEYIGAEDVMRWLHGRTSGVFGANGNASVAPVLDSMGVTVSDGNGWLSNDVGGGIAWWVDSEADTGEKLTLPVDMADGVLGRVDRVVVSWETTNYVALPEVMILKGTPSSVPTPPPLTNSNTVRQISLARISIPAGTTAITSDMITDERLDPSVCGIVTEQVGVDTSVMQANLDAYLAYQKAKWEAFFAGVEDDTVFPVLSSADKGKAVMVNENGDGYVLGENIPVTSTPGDGVKTWIDPEEAIIPTEDCSGIAAKMPVNGYMNESGVFTVDTKCSTFTFTSVGSKKYRIKTFSDTYMFATINGAIIGNNANAYIAKDSKSGIWVFDIDVKAGDTVTIPLLNSDYLKAPEIVELSKISVLKYKDPETGEQKSVGFGGYYTYGTADLTAGTSALETGKLYFVYE